MESSGNQMRLGMIDKLDAQGVSGYLNNVVVSAIVNNYDGGDTTPGIMFYLSTKETWGDSYVISAKACPIAGTVSLAAKRKISFDSEKASGNIGTVYLYAELTDITVTDDINCRFVVETWGRFVEWTTL